MKLKRIAAAFFAFALVLVLFAGAAPVSAAESGYTKSSDVQYVYYDKYVANWGYRNETCTFLSPMANEFYTDGNTYAELEKLSGGSGQDDAPESELYAALQKLMVDNHTHITTYDETRYEYMYTDCEGSDISTILSFYSGEAFGSTWDSGKTWNREHTWPNSKCLNTGKKQDSADIIMLRPTLKSENGSRGNKAYGESSGYYLPSEDVRGDCARIFLYVYVRWGNTEGNGKYETWGTNGVIENLDILLKWMEEDPVDTWEMGRNDAAESITGTRNVFVDYPELAWLLFGQEVPEDLVSPSSASVCEHENTETQNAVSATCDQEGYSGDQVCTDCGEIVTAGQTVAATGEHTYGQWVVRTEATTEAEGLEVRTCTVCNAEETRAIEKLIPDDNSSTAIIAVVAVAVVAAGVVVFIILKKRK